MSIKSNPLPMEYTLSSPSVLLDENASYKFLKVPSMESLPLHQQLTIDPNDYDDEDTVSVINTEELALTQKPSSQTNLSVYSGLTSSTNKSPNTDYATFRLTMPMSPFGASAIAKKSFYSLHQRHVKDKMDRKLKRTFTARTDTTISTLRYDHTTISFLASETIPKMGKWQTIFTIVNVYVNNTILINPYAVSVCIC